MIFKNTQLLLLKNNMNFDRDVSINWALTFLGGERHMNLS